MRGRARPRVLLGGVVARELEIKLAAAEPAARAVLRHPLVLERAQGGPRREHLLNVYYDTPDGLLRRNRVALRLRKAGRRWIQTVKTAGSAAAGLHARNEWELPTREGELRLDALPDAEVRAWFADPGLRAALAPVFGTHFWRSTLQLHWPDGDVVELAVDRGHVEAGGRRQPLCEVELELKAGSAGRLFELAAALCAELPLRLSNVSKAEAGQRLALDAPLQPGHAGAPALDGAASLGGACQAVLAAGLAHLQANEAGLLQTEDAEFVHQMRVACRRLRAALRLFSPLLPAAQCRHWCDELHWLGGSLDGVRNWDVFLEGTLPAIRAGDPDQPGLDWLQRQALAERNRQRVLARAALAEPRYQQLLLQMGKWLAAPQWREQSAVANMPAAAGAARLLQTRQRKLKKHGRQFGSLDAEGLHALRIEAKKLRYAAEFFATLYPGRRQRRYLKALSVLQHALGEVNDAATAAMLVGQLAAQARGRVRQQACGFVLGWLRGGGHAHGRSAAAAWKRWCRRKRFWPRLQQLPLTGTGASSPADGAPPLPAPG